MVLVVQWVLHQQQRGCQVQTSGVAPTKDLLTQIESGNVFGVFTLPYTVVHLTQLRLA